MELRGNQWNLFISWGSKMLKSYGIIHCLYVIFLTAFCLLVFSVFYLTLTYFFGKFACNFRL